MLLEWQCYALIYVVFLSVICSLVNTYQTTNNYNSQTCWTADNELGSCVPIENCDRITWLITNSGNPLPPFVIDYLRKSHCRTQGTTHFGCCAQHNLKRPSNFFNRPPVSNPPYSQNVVHPQYPASTSSSQIHGLSIGERILNSVPCALASVDRISNGELVGLSEYPWMALLEFSGMKTRQRFLCGGSLITNRYVLTAAHCVVGSNELIGVRLGEHDLSTEQDCERYYYRQRCLPPVENFGIERIISHSQYTNRPISNDIALIRLDRNVQFKNHIKPICLPKTPQINNNTPERITISGWGITEQGYASDVLMKAEIPMRDNGYCQDIYQNNLQISSAQMCGGGEERKSTCRGDSGSPVFAVFILGWQDVRFVQLGIVSAGATSCGSRHNFPAVYTKVSAYMDWISSNLEP